VRDSVQVRCARMRNMFHRLASETVNAHLTTVVSLKDGTTQWRSQKFVMEGVLTPHSPEK